MTDNNDNTNIEDIDDGGPEAAPETIPASQDSDPGKASQTNVSQSQNMPSRSGSKSGQKPDKYRKHILCRYGKMGNLGYFSHDIEDFPNHASHVIVNTERGLEIAEIVGHETCHKKGNCIVKESQIVQYTKDSCDNFPLDRKGSVVRPATEQDIREQKHLDIGIAKELSYCEELIQQQNLDMTLVDAERLFGGERIIFYFMADGRVDFRQLVKDLAQQYQTRIEMRQVGARDEARLVADFETCGRECCCRSFLKVLYPVNMRMAKLQKATLDPSKISGRCGRLKCCLRFEDEVYQEHKKKLPKKNSMVLTPEGPGKVIDTQVLTLLVKVYLNAGKMIAIPLDEIIEFNYVVPAEPEVTVKEKQRQDNQGGSKRRQLHKDTAGTERKAEPEVLDDELAELEHGLEPEHVDSTSASDSEGPSEPKKKRRRKRKRKKKSGDSPNPNNGGGNSD